MANMRDQSKSPLQFYIDAQERQKFLVATHAQGDNMAAALTTFVRTYNQRYREKKASLEVNLGQVLAGQFSDKARRRGDKPVEVIMEAIRKYVHAEPPPAGRRPPKGKLVDHPALAAKSRAR
jgi:hypothetical protein